MSVGLWSKSSFWVLCSGRVLYKYVYCLPLLYYITSMYALLLWVWAVWHKYKILYNRVKSPALFKNIFKFCTFCPNFQIFCPFFEKTHICPLYRTGPEYANWLWKKDVLGRKKFCITIKQNFVQTPTVINQVSIGITSAPLPRQFESFYSWWF